MLGNPRANTLRTCSNSFAIRRALPSLPFVSTRKCGLRTSTHGLSLCAAATTAQASIKQVVRNTWCARITLLRRKVTRTLPVSPEKMQVGFTRRFTRPPWPLIARLVVSARVAIFETSLYIHPNATRSMARNLEPSAIDSRKILEAPQSVGPLLPPCCSAPALRAARRPSAPRPAARTNSAHKNSHPR